jgi:hypothetical protein
MKQWLVALLAVGLAGLASAQSAPAPQYPDPLRFESAIQGNAIWGASIKAALMPMEARAENPRC